MFLSALLLALASSTDNFAVGLGLGVATSTNNNKVVLDWRLNGFISVCNAAGAYLAAVFGNLAGQQHGWISALASIAFFYLAYLEVKEDNDGNDNANKKSTDQYKIGSHPAAAALMLAIPMTLNNLVGGVAGGAAGITPIMGGTCALVAS